MKIAVIIPVYNKPQTTHECLTSVFKYEKVNPQSVVIAIDDGSNKMTKYCLKSYPVDVLTNPKNKGYLYSTNRGINYALDDLAATHIALLNNDVEVQGPWLANMVKYMDRYDLVGYYGRQYIGKSKHKTGYFLEFSCALIDSKVFKQIGVLDPRFPGGYYSDDDICVRAMCQGFKVGQLRNTDPQYIEHHIGLTNGTMRDLLIKKAYDVFLKKFRNDIHPVVKEYLKRWTWDPHKQEWGDAKRVRALRARFAQR